MPKKLTLFIFMDAMGWEVYQKHGFLKRRIQYAQPLKTVFGFSSAADPSILTGAYPQEHGHWSSFYFSPDTSPFKYFHLLSFLPKRIFDRFRVRHWLSKIMAKAYGYTGYFEIYSVPFKVLPYFDYLEKHDYFVPGGILNGDTIFDEFVQKGVPYHCSNWRLSESENLEIMKQEIRKEKIEFGYLYLPKLDGLMHMVGTTDPKVKAKLESYEHQIEEVLQTAERHYEEVNFYVISDHGMADVVGNVDLISKIEATGLKFGKDYVAMYDSTMARFWFRNGIVKQKIKEALEPIAQGQIVSEAELKSMNCFFENHQFGEMFFLLNPGYLITPCFMGLKSIPGMHGYHPDHKDSYAMIASNRPLSPETKSITDIRKVMQKEVFGAMLATREVLA